MTYRFLSHLSDFPSPLFQFCGDARTWAPKEPENFTQLKRPRTERQDKILSNLLRKTKI